MVQVDAMTLEFCKKIKEIIAGIEEGKIELRKSRVRCEIKTEILTDEIEGSKGLFAQYTGLISIKILVFDPTISQMTAKRKDDASQ